MFALVCLTAAVVVGRIGFGVRSPSTHDTVVRAAVTRSVENQFGYKDVSCSLANANLSKCTANGQSIGLFLLESNGVVVRLNAP